MSSETIEVKKRDQIGSNAVKQLRKTGYVPAILYGHGEENIALAVSTDRITNIIYHGTKLLSLTGDVTDTAILRDVQWDSFGTDVMHVDFTRVSKSEAVEVTLPVELHGEAPGSSEGGLLKHNTHEITILCPADKIPEHMVVHIGQLHIGQSIHASDLQLPAGASLVTPAEEVIVQVTPQPGAAAAEEAAATAEPELISRERKDGESEEAAE